MKKYILPVLMWIAVVFVLSGSQTARAQGLNWNVHLSTGKELEKVSILRVVGDSVDVGTTEGRARLAIGQIERLERRRSLLGGALLGAAVGGGAAFGVSTLAQNTTGNSDNASNSINVPAVIGGAAVGCAVELALASRPGARSIEMSSLTLEGKQEVLRSNAEGMASFRDTQESGGADTIITATGTMIITREPFATRPLELHLSIGLGLPTGDFGDNSSARSSVGSASTGVVIDGDIVVSISEYVNALVSVAVGSNSFDSRGLGLPYGFTENEGTWTTVWPLAGLKFTTDPEKNLVASAMFQGGALFGTSPELTVATSSFSLHDQSTTATAIAFRLGVGLEFRQKASLNLRYMYANPQYTAGARLNGESGQANWQQSTGMFEIALGWRVF